MATKKSGPAFSGPEVAFEAVTQKDRQFMSRAYFTGCFYTLMFLVCNSAVASAAQDTKKILLLFSSHKDLPGYHILEDNIRGTIERGSSTKIKFYVEYMDASRHASKEYYRSLVDFYRQKYANIRLDLAISVQGPALSLLIKDGKDLFPGTLVVFSHMPAGRRMIRTLPSSVTGVTSAIDMKPTLDLALALQPNLQSIEIIGGTSPIDRRLQARARSVLGPAARGRVKLNWLTELPFAELLTKVKKLPEDTAIIYLRLERDSEGQNYVPMETLEEITRAANAPVYVYFAIGLGHGVLGGYVVSHEAIGRKTGEVALRVLSGERPGDIAVSQANNVYMFDWRKLKHWGLSESQLPPGSIVLYKPVSIWDQYAIYLVGGGVVIFLLTLLLVVSAVNLRRRRNAEISLEQRLQFQSMLAQLAYAFVNAPLAEVDPGVDEGLKFVGEFFDVDRVTLIEFTEDRVLLRASHMWCAAGIPLDEMVLAATLKVTFPFLTDKLSHGESFNVPNLDLLPAEAAKEKEYCQARGILSTLIVPFEVGETVMVAIALDAIRQQRHWTDEEEEQLRFIGTLFENALQRNQARAQNRTLREELAHTSRIHMVEELSSTVIHELKQPLTAILNNAQAASRLLSSSPPRVSEVQEALLDIVDDGRRTNTLLENIRAMVKKQKAEFIDLDLNEVVNEVARLIRLDSTGRNVSLTFDLQPDLPKVFADRVQLQQVLVNLLLNAFDSIDQLRDGDRQVVVQTSMDSSGHISVSITDTGTGLNEEVSDKLFSSFFTTKPDGLGLGLMISRSIIESHGGHLQAAQNPGHQGATFSFDLPVSKVSVDTSHP